MSEGPEIAVGQKWEHKNGGIATIRKHIFNEPHHNVFGIQWHNGKRQRWIANAIREEFKLIKDASPASPAVPLGEVKRVLEYLKGQAAIWLAVRNDESLTEAARTEGACMYDAYTGAIKPVAALIPDAEKEKP